MRPTLVALVLMFLVSAGDAQAASFKRCGSFNYEGRKASIQAKKVSCTKAKKVLQSAGAGLCFDNTMPGWKKEFISKPFGTLVQLTSGAKVIRSNACSPR